MGQEFCHVALVPGLGRQRQEDLYEFKVKPDLHSKLQTSQDYSMRLCLKKRTHTHTNQIHHNSLGKSTWFGEIVDIR